VRLLRLREGAEQDGYCCCTPCMHLCCTHGMRPFLPACACITVRGKCVSHLELLSLDLDRSRRFLSSLPIFQTLNSTILQFENGKGVLSD